jgi:hypothetical protein
MSKTRYRLYNHVVVPFWNVVCRGEHVEIGTENIQIKVCSGICKLWTVIGYQYYGFGRGPDSLEECLSRLEIMLRRDGKIAEADGIRLIRNT